MNAQIKSWLDVYTVHQRRDFLEVTLRALKSLLSTWCAGGDHPDRDALSRPIEIARQDGWHLMLTAAGLVEEYRGQSHFFGPDVRPVPSSDDVVLRRVIESYQLTSSVIAEWQQKLSARVAKD